MKKSFILEDLECAHCGAKMEDAIGKIDGVKECNVNFIAQKLIIEAEEADFERIINEAKKIIKKIEPDCTLVI